MVKRTIISLGLIIIFNTNSIAQNENFSVGLKLLPGFSKETMLFGESFAPNIGASIFGVKNFSKTLGVESGISYRNYGSISDMTLIDIRGIVLGEYSTYYSFRYITIPVLLRINVNSFYITAGFNNNYITSVYEIPPDGLYENGEEMQKRELNFEQNFVFEPTLGIGYQFNFNNKFGLNLEGYASKSLTGKSYAFVNIGLGIGFCYFFSAKNPE